MTPILFPLLLSLSTYSNAFPREFFLPWPGGAIDEVFVGYFGADHALDLAVLEGGHLHYLHNAGSVAALTQAVSGVTGAATVGNGTPGGDAVAFTDAAGLHLMTEAPGPFGLPALQDLNLPGWAGRELYSGPWGDNTMLASVTATHVSVASWDGTAITPVCEIPYTGAVHDLVTADWDGDGSQEIAMVVDDRLNVFNAAGVPVATFWAGVLGGELGVSRSTSGRDVVVWEVTMGTFSILMAHNASGSLLRTVPVAPQGLVVLDQDGDGSQDLVRLNAQNSNDHAGTGHLLVRSDDGQDLASLSSFDDLFAEDPELLHSSPSCYAVGLPAVVRAAAAGDFDNDGDEDLLTAFDLADYANLRLRLNGTYNEVRQRMSWDVQNAPTVQGGVETVTLGFYASADPSYYSQATHMELELWTQLDPAGATGKTFVPGAPSVVYEELTHLPLVYPPAPTEYATFSYPEPQPTSSHVRLYLATLVELDVNDQVLSRGPSNLVYYVPDPEVLDDVYQLLPWGCGIDPTGTATMVQGSQGGFSNPPPPPTGTNGGN